MPSSLDQIITELIQQGSSDIFLSEESSIRMRMGGEITESDGRPVSREMMVEFWRACGADPDGTDFDKRYQLETTGQFMRVNLFRALGKRSASIRPIKSEILTMKELGLPADILESWFMNDSGLILVTGTSGAGKSTTVASALQHLAHVRPVHILTVEDPIEYLFTNDLAMFSQRELGSDTGGYSEALRASLRQNPDVIFIGEIRDEEGAEIAIRAAESGHLVVATLHSGGAVEAIERMSLMFPGEQREGVRRLLSQQLVGICSQVLLPTQQKTLMPVLEIMQNEGVIAKWIAERRLEDLGELLERGDSQVNVSMLRGLVNCVQSGAVDIETARIYAHNTHDFNRLLSGFI